MLQVNPLTFQDVQNSLKSTGKIFWIKRNFYIPFAVVLIACSWIFNTSFATMPLVPFIGLFFPSFCVVLAALLDHNRKVDVTIALRSTLSVSLYMIFFAIPSALVLFIMLFKPNEVFGFVQSIAPTFLRNDTPIELTLPKIISVAYSFTVLMTIFLTTELTTRLDMSYLRARHGLSEDEAHAKSVELLGSLNLAHGLSRMIASAIWVVPMILIPQISLMLIAIAFTFNYFILKAIYDGSSNTDAVESRAAKTVSITG